jgi:hypothetical protein
MTQSSAQLEREAQQTRSELAATLDELRSRITPGQLFDQTLDYARESDAGQFVRNLGRDARDNPLPLALIGAGIAWLMMTNGRRRNGVPAAYTDAALAASGETPAANASGVSHGAGAKGGSFLAFCREHPLVLGGIGLALGALAGAALPSSETEGRIGTGASGETKPADEDFAATEAVEDFRLGEASPPEPSIVPTTPGEHPEP